MKSTVYVGIITLLLTTTIAATSVLQTYAWVDPDSQPSQKAPAVISATTSYNKELNIK